MTDDDLFKDRKVFQNCIVFSLSQINFIVTGLVAGMWFPTFVADHGCRSFSPNMMIHMALDRWRRSMISDRGKKISISSRLGANICVAHTCHCGKSWTRRWGVPTQQKCHRAENESSVPYSRIFFMLQSDWLEFERNSSESLLALPAFLASAFGASDFRTTIFSETFEDVSFTNALEKWLSLTNQQEIPLDGTQKNWSQELISRMDDKRSKVFNAHQGKFGSQWLNVVPCPLIYFALSL